MWPVCRFIILKYKNILLITKRKVPRRTKAPPEPLLGFMVLKYSNLHFSFKYIYFFKAKEDTRRVVKW